MKLWIVASVLALLAACATLSRPSPSLSMEFGDPAICAAERDRLCIARIWLHLKSVF